MKRKEKILLAAVGAIEVAACILVLVFVGTAGNTAIADEPAETKKMPADFSSSPESIISETENIRYITDNATGLVYLLYTNKESGEQEMSPCYDPTGAPMTAELLSRR